ncbi:MAG: O-antigen ligase family protein [Patescibacteria group bacterium]
MFEGMLLALFTVCFLYIAWWKLDWAITLCVVLLPAYLIRFQAWFLPMTVLEVMVLALFCVWTARNIQTYFRSRACPASKPWLWTLAGFLCAGTAALFIAPDLRAAAGLWKAYVLEPLMFFFVFVNVIRTKQQVRQVLWGLGSSAVFVGFYAMLQYLGIADIPAHYGFEMPRRATSVFPFPTAVGKYVGPIVALFAGILITRGLGQARPLWELVQRAIFPVGVIVFGTVGLLFSVSRGALLGVLVAVVFASFFSRWRTWLWIGIVVAMAAMMLVPQVRSNVGSVFDASDASTDVRLVMWKGAWRIIENHPIFGTGLASFPVVYEDYKEASHTEYFPNPDHLILTLWIEMGALGLVAFGWVILRYFRAAIQSLRTYRPYAVGLMAAMVAILAHGFLDTPYFKNDLAVEFWILVGIAVILSQLSRAEKAQV